MAYDRSSATETLKGRVHVACIAKVTKASKSIALGEKRTMHIQIQCSQRLIVQAAKCVPAGNAMYPDATTCITLICHHSEYPLYVAHP